MFGVNPLNIVADAARCDFSKLLACDDYDSEVLVSGYTLIVGASDLGLSVGECKSYTRTVITTEETEDTLKINFTTAGVGTSVYLFECEEGFLHTSGTVETNIPLSSVKTATVKFAVKRIS